MSNELDDYLVSELGFSRKTEERVGLRRSISAFLGPYLEQRTPIQETAIETIYDGANALLMSATASGKTEAVLVPITARLISESTKSVALYIAPTRALVNDLYRRVEAPLHQLGLEAVVRHGDHSLPADTSSIRVLFTTPESLDVLLSKRTTLLKRVRYIIIDEIHQLFATLRGDHLGFLLQRLEYFVESRLQRIALSATVGNPDGIARWLCPCREPACLITIPQKRKINAEFRWASDIQELREVLRTGRFDKTLCFANSRRRCEDIYLQLQDLYPLQPFVHYSTLTTEQRHYVERGFKTAQMAVCVATSTLELGIDIGSIHEVVLADAPATVSSFIQRVGRGGRRGLTNHVTVTPGNLCELLQFAVLLHYAETGLVETVAPAQPYSVFVQQVFSILAGKKRLVVHPDELYEQLGISPWLGPKQIRSTLDALVEQGYLRREPGSQVYGVGVELEEPIEKGTIYTNIPTQDSGIPVYYNGRLLAYLPLIDYQIKHGNVILFAGRFWQITSTTSRGLRVESVSAVPDPIRPMWGGHSSFTTSSLVATGMRHFLLDPPNLSRHQFDPQCTACLSSLNDKVVDRHAERAAVWYEHITNRHIYYTFAGAIENELLSLLFKEAGVNCSPVVKAEGIALESKEPIDFNQLRCHAEVVTDFIQAHWRQFVSSTSTGPYFGLLPPPLQRDEILAQITHMIDIKMVTGFAGAKVMPLNLGLLS